jgi:hypothetical protein
MRTESQTAGTTRAMDGFDPRPPVPLPFDRRTRGQRPAPAGSAADARGRSVAAGGRWLDRAWVPFALTCLVLAVAVAHAWTLDKEAAESSRAVSDSEALRLHSLTTAWRSMPREAGPPLIARPAPAGEPSRLPVVRRPPLKPLVRPAVPQRSPPVAAQEPAASPALPAIETSSVSLSVPEPPGDSEAKADGLAPVVEREVPVIRRVTPPPANRGSASRRAQNRVTSRPGGPKGLVVSARPRPQVPTTAEADTFMSLIGPPSPTIAKVALQSP